MHVNFRKDRRAMALLAAPAFALALAACGGGEEPVSTSAADAPAAAVQEAETSSSSDAAAAPASNGSGIQLLSAGEAIANAEVNQPNLQTSQNVLDIQTLAVGDGSIATLRDVVDGDKPVLLWFFSPH